MANLLVSSSPDMADSSKRPLLVLDLDETLIFGSEVELQRPADFRIGPFHLYRRPHLASFLKAVSACYDLAVWSSASADYVSGIARELAKVGIDWCFVWSRVRCVERLDPETCEVQFLKDLKKVKRLGYGLDRVLIVDDTRHKVARNYGNAIYTEPFEGAEDDIELLLLREYVLSLRGEPDFRRIEKRGWRSLPGSQ
jgi:TFIIF-interacting CTD phosphatase-like protein